MVGAIGLTLALRFASMAGTAGEAGPPAPAPAARVLAAPVLARQDLPGDVLALSAREPGPAATFPLYYQYRPREWVVLVADRLNMRDAGVVHVALWVASCPLRLDASGARISLRVTLPTP